MLWFHSSKRISRTERFRVPRIGERIVRVLTWKSPNSIDFYSTQRIQKSRCCLLCVDISSHHSVVVIPKGLPEIVRESALPLHTICLPQSNWSTGQGEAYAIECSHGVMVWCGRTNEVPYDTANPICIWGQRTPNSGHSNASTPFGQLMIGMGTSISVFQVDWFRE